MGRYFALDVETANLSQASICQIGVVKVVEGEIVNEYNWLIDPEEWFDPFHVRIHGIDASKVKGCKTYKEIHKELSGLLEGEIVIHHGAFDKGAISRVSEKYSVVPAEFNWVDSTRVVRRVFEDFRSSGYGLANLAKHFGFEFKHHDALEDAKVTVRVMEACLSQSESDVEEWTTRQFTRSERMGEYSSGFRGAEGNPDGPLYGEKAVFTGALTMSREEVSSLAAKEGITVQTGVNKETTMLVAGIQNQDRLKEGENKSGKHRKAEDKIAKGQEIQILSESDFMSLLRIG